MSSVSIRSSILPRSPLTSRHEGNVLKDISWPAFSCSRYFGVPQCSSWCTLSQIAHRTEPHDSVHRDDDEPQKRLHPCFCHDAEEGKGERGLTEHATKDQNHEADVDQFESLWNVFRVFDGGCVSANHSQFHSLCNKNRVNQMQ